MACIILKDYVFHILLAELIHPNVGTFQHTTFIFKTTLVKPLLISAGRWWCARNAYAEKVEAGSRVAAMHTSEEYKRKGGRGQSEGRREISFCFAVLIHLFTVLVTQRN